MVKLPFSGSDSFDFSYLDDVAKRMSRELSKVYPKIFQDSFMRQLLLQKYTRRNIFLCLSSITSERKTYGMKQLLVAYPSNTEPEEKQKLSMKSLVGF